MKEQRKKEWGRDQTLKVLEMVRQEIARTRKDIEDMVQEKLTADKKKYRHDFIEFLDWIEENLCARRKKTQVVDIVFIAGVGVFLGSSVLLVLAQGVTVEVSLAIGGILVAIAGILLSRLVHIHESITLAFSLFLPKFRKVLEHYPFGVTSVFVSSKVGREKGWNVRGEYRRKIGTDKWHWCKNCSDWPKRKRDCDVKRIKPNVDLCEECIDKEKHGTCKT